MAESPNIAVSGGEGKGALLASLLGGGISLLSGVVSNWMNRANWKRQNEYNRPINQMGRFRQAGLNPNLAVDKGDFSGASALAPFNPTSAVAQSASMAAQTKRLAALLNLDIADKAADIDVKKENAEGVRLLNFNRRVQNAYEGARQELQIKGMDIMNRLNNGQISRIKAQKELDQARTKFVNSQYQTNEYYRLNMQPAEYQLLDQEYGLGQQRIRSGALDLGMKEMDYDSYTPAVGVIKNYVEPIVDAATGVSQSFVNTRKGIYSYGRRHMPAQAGRRYYR